MGTVDWQQVLSAIVVYCPAPMYLDGCASVLRVVQGCQQLLIIQNVAFRLTQQLEDLVFKLLQLTLVCRSSKG